MSSPIKVFTDGASRGNPGKASVGIYITDVENNKLAEYCEYIGGATNNTAEYTALLKSIDVIKSLELSFGKIEFYCDSELVVKQITGVYKIKHKDLVNLSLEFYRKIKESGKEYSITYIPRTKNKEADRLANKALDEHAKDERVKALTG